jgi:hypothetical protein
MSNDNRNPAPRPWRVGTAKALSACLVAAALFGAGCTATGKNAIPSGADRVASGEGPIDYRAQRNGDIWVYDANTKKMVYTGPVNDGDRVRVNTETNQILVGGRTVSERPLAGNHKYEIYFRRPS